MLLPGNASLVLSSVQQLIKLGSRIDTLLAQHAAVDTQLVLGMPAVALGSVIRQCQIVQTALDETKGQTPDPFGTDRAVLLHQLSLPQPEPIFGKLFAQYFPDQNSKVINPDAAYLAQLKQAFPSLDWSEPSVRIAALALAAGKGPNQTSYYARVALAVADTLFEFGADNTALFVRDPKLQGIVRTVLVRFAQPDWASFDSWNPLLQTALKVTLNSALDVGEQLPPKNPWLDGVLNALVEARAAVPADQQDNYLLGLVQGEGVPLLLSKGLLVASTKLNEAGASSFQHVAADVLTAAAPMIQNTADPDLGNFFKNHWGDLLRAGLSSLDQHGDQLLDPTNPLLNSVLKALVQQLANTPNPGLLDILSSESLYHLADTAIGAVAQNPDEVNDLTNKPWLAAFITSVAQSAQQLTAKNLLSSEAADAILRDAMGVVGKYPSLVVSGDGLPVKLVGGVFTAVSQLPRLDARTIGETAVRSALTAIANDPTLAAKPFGPVVTAVATQLAADVGQGRFTADQAAGVVSAAIDAIARNPKIYAGAQQGIAGAVVSAVQHALPADADWAARLLVQTAQQTLLVVARNGASTVGSKTVAEFEQLLTTILSSGLTTAADKLGTNTDLDSIPPILGGLVAQGLRGNLTVFDPTSPQFTDAFDAIANQLQAA